MKRNLFSEFSDGQLNLAFTIIMSETTGNDPFEMEEELRNKGIIDKSSTL